jgi:hypothetical protein
LKGIYGTSLGDLMTYQIRFLLTFATDLQRTWRLIVV